MSPRGAEDPLRAVLLELERRRALGEIFPVLRSEGFGGADGGADRFEPLPDRSGLAAGGISADAFVLLSVEEAVGVAWEALRRAAAGPGPGPKIIAAAAEGAGPLPLSDLAAFVSLARTRVGVPADAAGAAASVRAAAESDGPVYLRVPSTPGAPIGTGLFGFGRAPELRGGADLTVIGVGPPLALALGLADRLHAVGLEVRVLDGASVKPLDTPSVLRAARETGAILTVEAHHALTGAGALVAAVTAASYPVPVRRIGLPDLDGGPGTAVGADRLAAYGLTEGRLDEEAFELLRARGKVH
ncbi:MAG: transketolase C-terminal domain-containing protein [Thermoplasmata archaeon]